MAVSIQKHVYINYENHIIITTITTYSYTQLENNTNRYEISERK